MAIGMIGLAYASVPLYAMFCQATGYNGTTQRASTPSSIVLDRTVTVMFDSNVNGTLPWTFEPVQRTIEIKLGVRDKDWVEVIGTVPSGAKVVTSGFSQLVDGSAIRVR